MNIRLRRRERHGLHVADPLAETPGQQPEYSPEVRTKLAELQAQAEAEDWYGLTALDLPPAHDRPYIAAPLPAPPPPPMPCSGVSAIWVSRITYPQPGDLSFDHGLHYRETLRHIGRATGTSTSLERADAWPQFAIEAGTGVAA